MKVGKLGPDQLCAMQTNTRVQMEKRSISEGPTPFEIRGLENLPTAPHV